ncbi:MAG: glycoside hydrolase family 2 TIM barrel-domain containing protein [Bacteroidaceae bacterium]
MKKVLLLSLLSFVVTLVLNGQSRIIIPLNDNWGYKPIIKTRKDVPLTNVTLPHTWNAHYLKGTTQYNRETMVYERQLNIPADYVGKRIFLYFEGVNSAAHLFINKKSIGEHLGGYTAFCFEITDFIKQGDNELEMWVSNAYRTDVLPISGDFNIYGGIHRPCHLILTNKDCISPVFYASPGIFIHQDSINKKEAKIHIESILSIKGKKEGLALRTVIKDISGKIVAQSENTVADSIINQPFILKNPVLWDGKANPYLYTVDVTLLNHNHPIDNVSQQTGFRYFKVDPDKGFYLNGHYLNLVGFCRHEELQGKGSALTFNDYQNDMNIIEEVGATAMRLVHYPHGEPIYDLSDKHGIVLWSEIPMCGPGGYNYAGYLHNDAFENNARQVLKEMVYQKYNHPSIFFWSLFNEILVNYDNPVPFIKELNGLFKKIDPSRLTTFATCIDLKNYLGCSDLTAWNKYFGWKEDISTDIGTYFDEQKILASGYPVGVSEYGAGGSIKQHLENQENKKLYPGTYHPEEIQTLVHESNWLAFSQRPYLWCKFIWVFSDFQSCIRNEGDRAGINDKGLITYDHKTRKDAFYLYKANWNPEPMIYITGKRMNKRTFATTTIKVFSNLQKVTLFVNGEKITTKSPDIIKRVIFNNITFKKGENQIEVRGTGKNKELKDSCSLSFQ